MIINRCEFIVCNYLLNFSIMKSVFLTTVLLMLAWCVSAQDAGAGKKVLFVDYFTYTSGIGNSYPTMLKNAIIGSIQETGRLNVIDAELEPTLKVEEARRSSEEALGDNKSRTEQIKKLGADYIMRIHVTQMQATKKLHDDKSVYYDGLINFTLTVMNAADGTVMVSKPFSYAGLNAKTGDTPEAAVVATTDFVKISMNKFVNDYFKLESKVVAIETAGKKGAQTVYINCGSAAGIDKGQLFDVFMIKEVAGKKLRTNIGQLEVVEVQGEDMALCKVKKGGEAIKKANDDQVEMPVISGKKKVGPGRTMIDILK